MVTEDSLYFSWEGMISLSIQYEQKPLYFCTSNVSHQGGLITTHCTNAIPPTAHASFHNCSLMLHLQVTPFTQHHFNLGLSVHGLIHPVAGMTSHMNHHTAWLSSQAVCLYSSLFSHSTSPLMCTQFYLQMTMSCSSQQNCHVAHA